MALRIFNTLSRSREEIIPRETGQVRMYSCGPTVYRYAHIGNLRTYIFTDWLRRALSAQGNKITHVKNITDVGHMRQEALEQGEDKVLAAALAEGKPPLEIAKFYTDAFLNDEAKLNILPAQVFPHASQHITEIIELVKALLDKGFAYQRQGNVYFDIGSFPNYGKLSRQRGDALTDGVRVEVDSLKTNQRDFTLWKAAEAGRSLCWPSPWGVGFPGWHIECSAMAIKHLGAGLDIHTGGVDNIFPHHEDEIAQSEAALGRPFARYWVHGQHLLVDGVKMAKSTGNVYTLANIEARGFDPLAFRYLCATCHYRSRMNFTFPALVAAQRALLRLRSVIQASNDAKTTRNSKGSRAWRQQIWEAIEDDLNLPQALGIAWQLARSNEPLSLKRELLLEFDQIFGFDLGRSTEDSTTTHKLQPLAEERISLRKDYDYPRADVIRSRLIDDGFEVRDGQSSCQVIPRPLWSKPTTTISASTEVQSLIDNQDSCDFSVSLISRDNQPEVEQALAGLLPLCKHAKAEVIVVDNGSTDDTAKWIEKKIPEVEGLRLIRADHNLGAAAARNVAMRQARGRIFILMDTSVEVTGDLFSSLTRLFVDDQLGIGGRWGVTSNDLRQFHETETSGNVDAVEGYVMAFPRRLLREIGLLDEKYRFYRHLDLDLSFSIRSLGYRLLVDTDLPVIRHEHGEWARTPPNEREQLSKRNFYRFLHKWGKRTDLLTTSTRRGEVFRPTKSHLLPPIGNKRNDPS